MINNFLMCQQILRQQYPPYKNPYQQKRKKKTEAEKSFAEVMKEKRGY